MMTGLASFSHGLLRRARDGAFLVLVSHGFGAFSRWLVLALFSLFASGVPVFAEPGWTVRGFRTGDGLKINSVATLSMNPKREIGIRYTFEDTVTFFDGYQFDHLTRLPNSPGADALRVYKSRARQLWSIYPDGIKVFTGDTWDELVVDDIRNLLLKNRTLTLVPVEQNRVFCLLPDKLIECVRKAEGETKDVRAGIKTIKTAAELGIGRLLTVTATKDGGLFIAGSIGVVRLEGPLRNIARGTPISRWRLEGFEITERQRPIEDSLHGFSMIGVQDKDAEEKKVIIYFDGANFSIVDPHDNSVHFAWKDSANKFFVVTLTSLFSVEDGRKVLWNEPPRGSYYDVLVEEDRVFWLATSDGLFRFAPQIWQPLANPPNEGNIVLMADVEGQSRVVSTTNAIYVELTNGWQRIDYPANFKPLPGMPGKFYPLATNGLVFGDGERMYRLDLERRVIDEVYEENSRLLKPLGSDPSGGVYVQRIENESSRGLLERFDGVSFHTLPDQQGRPSNVGDWRFVTQGVNDELWLAGSLGFGWFHNGTWSNLPLRKEDQEQVITSAQEVEPGVLWLGFRDRILAFSGARTNWTEVKHGFDGVNAILKDKAGRMWVATGNGLWSLYKDIWSWNGIEEGLPSPTIQFLYQAKGGPLWAGTTAGLASFAPRADVDPPRILPITLDKLAGTEGSIRLGFRAEDRWNVTPRSSLLFSTRKDDGEWSAFSSDGTATYADLSGGKHTFQVRAMDRNWNLTAPSEIDFNVVPPWNKDPRLLSIMIVGGLLISFLGALALNRHWRLVRSYAEVEKIVRLRTQQLEKANQELLHSQKMNALGTLAAGIAHDFNNILSIIKGSAQIIEKNPRDLEKIQTRVDRIKMVSDQGAGIVKAMLGFSRISEKVMALHDINVVVEDTIVLLGDRFQKDINLEFEWAPGLPKVLIAKDFVQQMLLNLIFNSADAMGGRGQIILKTGETRSLPGPMILHPPAAVEHIFISVMDFGVGIDPENITRIFEPFFTTKAFSARRGTGLGLSMVYELAREMQCGLHVESILGKGSTFTLYVPVPSAGA